jgi:hypothetical protein
LGKNECDVSEEETGRNRKSENISELKKKRKKIKKRKNRKFIS